MSSIKEVGLDRRDEVSNMLEEFIQTVDEKHRPGPQMMDRMLSLWSEGSIEILGKFDDDKQILGIVLLSLISNRLSFVHIHPSKVDLDEIQRHNLERELFDAGFERLKGYESWVTSGGSSMLTKNLVEYALTLGFKKYEQIQMAASREVLEKLQMPLIPAGYTLENYEDRWKETIARLLYESFKDSPERNVEPNELTTVERCLDMINDTVADRYGDFKNGRHSWVLKYGDEIVGVSFRTIMNGTIGFGVGMCLNPIHRGKGLGRLIFTHSLRSMLRSVPQVKEMNLATISTNPSRRLYESVGFKVISRHTGYTWMKDEHS